MSPETRICPESAVRNLAREAGACACAIIRAAEVDVKARESYNRWLTDGLNGTMAYCEQYEDVRNDPRLLLHGCKWLIICAFNYNPGPLPHSALHIARYALGRDYHTVLPEMMRRMTERLTQEYGGETLIAVDTKPLRERYWAQRSGLGWIGKNNQLIVPGIGSYVFIATALYTGDIAVTAPPSPEGDICGDCDACIRACPAHALTADAPADCRKCLSYLTIEHKGDIPDSIDTHRWLYGCDVCQIVCPHNRTAPVTEIEQFRPRSELLALTADDLLSHSGRSWQRFLGDSAMRRVPLKKLLSTLRHIHS